MKLVDDAKLQQTEIRPVWYRKKWSPRTTIVFTVLDAIVTGFFLGVTLLEYMRGREPLSWMFPLGMAFINAVSTLRGTLVALGNCSRST